MPPTVMNLKILLPFRIFAEKGGVSRIGLHRRGHARQQTQD